MKKFNLEVLVNYGRNVYKEPFEVENEDEFYEVLVRYWNDYGLHRGEDEIYIYTNIEFEGSPTNFRVGRYILNDDDELECLFYVPNEDEIGYSIAESLIGDLESSGNEEDLFYSLVEAIFESK
jgi:hypothetical protein